MTRERFRWLLIAEGAVCLLLWAVQWRLEGSMAASLLSFPLGPIGGGLRALSLSGAAGNALAVALYVLLSLLPLLGLLFVRRKRELKWEDSLLALLSAELFGALWLNVNPHLIHALPGLETAGKAAVGGICWCTALGYGVLRVVRRLQAADGKGIYRALKVLLAVLAVVLTAAACYACPAQLCASLADLAQANQGNEHLLLPTQVVLGLECLVDMAAWLLDTAVVLGGWKLLDTLGEAGWSEIAVEVSEALSRRCANVLRVTVVLGLACSALKLLLIRQLSVVSVTISVPLMPIALVLAVLVLTRLLRANKSLREENDLFV